MTIRGGGDPNARMALRPTCRMGPPLRSSAADAYYCIMVQIPRIYRIQVCGAILRAPAGERPSDRPETHPNMPKRGARRDLALDGKHPIQVVRQCTSATLLHRQPGLGAIERLYLRLLVDREHNGMGRREVGRMATRRDKLLDGFPRSGSSLCTKSGPSNGELGLLLFDSRGTLLITLPVATPSARRPSSGIWARRNRSDGFARDLHPDAPGLDFPNTDTQDSRIAAQAYALDSDVRFAYSLAR